MTETRQAILEATQAILLESGYDALTTSRVAERADVSEAGVHYHFETKSALLVAVVEQLEALHRERTAGYEGPADERLVAALTDQFRAAATIRDLTAPPSFQLISRAAAGDDPLLEALRSLDDTQIALLTEVLEAGAEEGVLRVEEPAATAAFLCSLADAAAVLAALDRPVDPVVDGLERYVLPAVFVDDPPTLEVEPAEVSG